MPLGDLLHAYSYTYADQILDGIHGEQSIVPPHLIDFTHGLKSEDLQRQGDAAEGSHSRRSSSSIYSAHEQSLRDLRLRRRQLAKEARHSSSRRRSSSNQTHKHKREAQDGEAQIGDGTKAGRPTLNTGRPTYTPPTAASFYIPTLPGLPADSTLTLYGGHLPSTVTSTSIQGVDDDGSDDPSDAHLFFFLAKAKHIDQSQKLVIWLNGGPGCSSFDGALMEIGPLRMVEGKKGELYEQDGAWNEYANVMFIDQPAGTGYSYVSQAQYVHSGEDAAKQVVTFLKNFYEVFPEYQKMDTYIAGESFAGIWIPYIANELQNTKVVSPPLKGLLIGNGWIDPYNQYPAYVDFSYAENLLKEGTTPTAGLSKVKRVLERCNRERERIGFEKFPINFGPCEAILSTITETTIQTVNGQKLCVNNYDIRLTDSHPSCGMNWPNLLPDMYSYLPRQDVVNAFHASARKGKWAECSGRVSDSFWGHTKPSVHLLPRLLESGLPILLFSGMQDLICNHVGTEKMIENLTWNGATGWGDGETNNSVDGEAEDDTTAKAADIGPQTWWVDGKKAGTWQTARNLTYVQVYNSSHMVPFDLPIVAHDMLSRFIGTDFFAAAGASAKVSSRIGNEQAAIIGETHLNGSALDSTSQKQSTELDESGGNNSQPENPMADAYYNIGAAVLILLILILAGVAFIWRQRRKRAHRYGGFGSGPKGTSLPTSISNGHESQHSRRGRSSVDDYRRAAGDAEEANELLPMGQHEVDDSSLSVGKQQHAQQSRSDVDLPKGEELFSVGEDEIDSEEEGNIGRPGRKFSALSDDIKASGSESKERYDV